MQEDNILVWLPSPMGDAVLCTPALRAIRQLFRSAEITFFANSVVREVLSGTNFNDVWLEQQSDCSFETAKKLKGHNFTHVILFKNSFGSALTVFLARIPIRTGYARNGRSLLLTDKLYPVKFPCGNFKPISMVDYYLAIASWLGADIENTQLELALDPKDGQTLKDKLPDITGSDQPIVVLVPGGAYGPSKCWPSDRFAKTADRLIENYNAKVVVSVSPNPVEKQIAQDICQQSKNDLINLAENPVSLGELKSLLAMAELVITNDTGPRHIAIALKRKLVTLFGPNDPAWTDTGYENEIQIVGTADCVPCQKPVCRKDVLICMESITIETVCDAAEKLLV